MKKSRIALCLISVFTIALFSACSSSAPTVIEMELSENYSDTEPFINEKAIFVSEDVEDLSLDVSFNMDGEKCTFDIADEETEQVLFSNTWERKVENSKLNISLEELSKDRAYILRLTGTGIKNAKVSITSQSPLVKERVRPNKPAK